MLPLPEGPDRGVNARRQSLVSEIVKRFPTASAYAGGSLSSAWRSLFQRTPLPSHFPIGVLDRRPSAVLLDETNVKVDRQGRPGFVQAGISDEENAVFIRFAFPNADA